MEEFGTMIACIGGRCSKTEDGMDFQFPVRIHTVARTPCVWIPVVSVCLDTRETHELAASAFASKWVEEYLKVGAF